MKKQHQGRSKPFCPEKVNSVLQKEDPLMLEIGAHSGGDTRIFLSLFDNIRLYSFEPDPRCIRMFKNNVKDDRSTLIEAAVSDSDGTTTLSLSTTVSAFQARIARIMPFTKFLFLKLGFHKESLGQATIEAPVSGSDDYKRLMFHKMIEVKTIKLSTWVREANLDLIDFIWADVQGAERRLIEGAAEALKKTRYFYTEYGETSPYPTAMTREETIELMQKHGFGVVDKYSSTTRIGDLLFENQNLAQPEG